MTFSSLVITAIVATRILRLPTTNERVNNICSTYTQTMLYGLYRLFKLRVVL